MLADMRVPSQEDVRVILKSELEELCVGSGCALGRRLDSLVPQFPHQRNVDVAFAKAKIVSLDLYWSLWKPRAMATAKRLNTCLVQMSCALSVKYSLQIRRLGVGKECKIAH